MSTEVELDKVLIIDKNSIAIDADNKSIEPCVQESDFTVVAKKKEYSIVGDGLYATVNSKETPEWLNATIDAVIDARLSTSLADLRESQNSLLTAINEIQLANNSYDEFIQYTDDAEQRVVTKIDQAQVNLGNSIAANTSLIDTRVTADTASSIAGNVISASINNDSPGEIGAEIRRLDNAIVNTNTSFAASVEILETSFEELSYATSTLETTVEANATKAEANFAYNAQLTLNDFTYTSGFGLATSINSPTIPIGTSEFWINAEKFKFTNEAQSGTVTPFTIDTSGTTPQVSFNGIVDFTNTNLANGLPGTTTINGGLITTGSIDANLITTGVIYLNSLDTYGAPVGYSGTIADSRGIRVYENGVIRVKLGNLV